MYKVGNKVVAVVQARMGSTRLPGKVMMEACGKPLLGHLIARLKKAKTLDSIIIATTFNKEDDIIAGTAKSYGADVFRGSEDDVLDRYYQAAKKYSAAIIVRITSDCPLIDPDILDMVVGHYLAKENKLDYVSNTLVRSYPRGLDVEVFSFKALEKVWQEAKEPYQREHVTIYIYEHPELFRLDNVKSQLDLSHMRWTVDTKEDFELVSRIYERLYRHKDNFLTEDVLKLFKDEPELLEINRHIIQKPVKIK